MDAPTVQQPMQTGWMSYNPYQAQQQAQMEEYMRQQQLLELQRQVRRMLRSTLLGDKPSGTSSLTFE